MQTIGENIRKARKAKKYNQEQVAEMLGVSRSTYAEWEQGTEPKITMLIKIADVLDVTIVDLVAGIIDEDTVNKVGESGHKKAQYNQMMEVFIAELAKMNAKLFGEPEAEYKRTIMKKLQTSGEK